MWKKHERGKHRSTIEICKAITSYGCHRDNAYKRHSPRVHCYRHLVWQFTYTHQRHRTAQCSHLFLSLSLSDRITSFHIAHTHTMSMHIHVAEMFVNVPYTTGMGRTKPHSNGLYLFLCPLFPPPPPLRHGSMLTTITAENANDKLFVAFIQTHFFCCPGFFFTLHGKKHNGIYSLHYSVLNTRKLARNEKTSMIQLHLDGEKCF